LESWSRQRGWTKSHAIRVAVRVLTRGPAADPLLEASGMIDGLPANLSAEMDRYLEQTFVAPKTRRPRREERARSRVRR
jgi:hypothetical protein